MSFLSRVLGPSVPMPVPREDDTLGYGPAKRILVQARRGDWKSIRDAFGKEKDPAIRSMFADAIAGIERAGEWIREWIAGDGSNPDAWLVSGVQSIHRGWKIRGNARGSDVAESSWNPFLACIGEAETALMTASKLHPADPLPWSYRLITAMALEKPVEHRLACLDAARTVAPAYHGACLNAVGALARKWGGSHELMFDMARRVTAEAPEGSAVPVALARAHFERFLYYVAFEKDERGAAAHIRNPAVQAEVRAAHAKSAGLSGPLAILVAGNFAWCFWQLGDRKTAKAELIKTGGLFDSSYPWTAQTYARALKECW